MAIDPHDALHFIQSHGLSTLEYILERKLEPSTNSLDSSMFLSNPSSLNLFLCFGHTSSTTCIIFAIKKTSLKWVGIFVASDVGVLSYFIGIPHLYNIKHNTLLSTNIIHHKTVICNRYEIVLISAISAHCC